jgi:hypothetical protein
MITIYPDVEGLSHRALHRLLVHPSCTKLELLSIRLPHDASTTVLAVDPNDVDLVDFPSALHMLIFAMGGDRLEISSDILVSNSDVLMLRF